MQLQITHDRIYFTNLRNEQVVIGHPPEYADAIAGLIQFCRAYRTPDERALDRMLMAARRWYTQLYKQLSPGSLFIYAPAQDN